MLKKFKFILFLMILFIPFEVDAYGIENYYIDATIEENGDLLVQEYFNLTGDFNGFERIINYRNSESYEFDSTMDSFGGSSIHNGSDLDILEVRALPISSTFSFDNIEGNLFTKTYSASKGDYGVYEEDYREDGKSILIYNPSTYNKAFYIKYRIKNMAIKHNDVGEIGWNVVGSELTESVSNLRIYLHIPGNTNVRAWAHGPLNGNVSIVDSETILFTLSNLSSYRAVDIRSTFDLNVIKNSIKVTNVDALDKIILYEEDKAAQANYERQNQEKINIQNAEEALSEFSVNVTRYNYNNAKYYILKVTDEQLKSDFLDKLSVIKLELDEVEKNEAIVALKYARKYPEYVYYMDAKEKVEILDNYSVREELLEELLVVENLVREREKNLEIRNYTFGFIFLFIILGIGYIVYKKYVKDPNTEFNYKYFREIPSDYSPHTVSYLFHKKIINNSMSATLLDLINRKIILAEKLRSNNYKLTLNEENAVVTNVESKLLKLIFNGESSIETKDMKNDARKNYDSFIRRWNSYQTAALNDAKGNDFFEVDAVVKSKSSKKNYNNNTFIIIFVIIASIFPILFVLGFMILIPYLIVKLIIKSVKLFKSGDLFNQKFVYLILLIISINLCIVRIVSILIQQRFYNLSFIVYIIVLILSIILIPFIFYNKKRTEFGALEYKKWKALKNFLNDFGSFKDKEVPEVTLWEKYLVFATLFGCAEKVIKAMKVEMVNAPDDYFDTYLDLYIMNRYISSAVRSSHSYAQSAYAAAHSSSGSGGFSSGGGGGGGFSSGGGSFGGGGGGGRF